jgi:hypothetical protein
MTMEVVSNLPEQIVKIRMDRIWSMPNKWTFSIPPIKKLVLEELCEPSIDPFAGRFTLASVTNDINPNIPSMFHEDALIFLQKQPSNHYMTAFYDPPYSSQQFRICYNEFGQQPNKAVFNAHWQSVLKDNIARILKPGGKAICCGWNSVGIGKGRGFHLDRILLVCHGRQHNDLIVTVETKTNSSLSEFTK